ncbi:MAG TPA: sulfur carrier protein ThiS [Gammaproteobacteria bacterium]|jgi:thiamine biosynthesis protein ThiS|nr:sulfur carrier protein ThiS [Gammaproteobacteria bacterium]
MITVRLNGKNIQINAPLTLKEFLINQSLTAINYAVSLNYAFVMRADYEKIQLKNQDHIDIIYPMQGG